MHSTLDNRSLAISVLAVTASVLFVGLMLVSQQPAQAIGMNDRGGDYIMLTQQISNTDEAVVLIDAAAKQMIIYNFDYNNKTLEMITPAIPLQQLPKPQAPNPERPRRRR